jgi:hypothetical protein
VIHCTRSLDAQRGTLPDILRQTGASARLLTLFEWSGPRSLMQRDQKALASPSKRMLVLNLLEARQSTDAPDVLLRLLYELMLDFNKRGVQRVDNELVQYDWTSSSHGWYAANWTLGGFLNSRHAALIRPNDFRTTP